MLVHCPYHWLEFHLCVLGLCGRVLASGIYDLLAAGSLVCSVSLVCTPRRLLLDTNFLRTLRAISGAALRFTASSRVAAGSLTCDIGQSVHHQCI